MKYRVMAYVTSFKSPIGDAVNSFTYESDANKAITEYKVEIVKERGFREIIRVFQDGSVILPNTAFTATDLECVVLLAREVAGGNLKGTIYQQHSSTE